MKKAKLFLPLFGLLFLAGCSTATSSTNANNNTTEGNSNGTVTDVSNNGDASSTLAQDSESQNILAYQAVTSVGLLDTLTGTSSTTSSFDAIINKKAAQKTLSDATIESIKTYLPSVEAALNGENSMIQSTTTTSDRDGYAYKQTITSTDMNNITSTYVIYYNELATVTEKDDDHWYNNEVETKTFLEGIILIDGIEYTMKGKMETESDETEVSFRYYTDTNSYVEVGQSTEFEHAGTEVEFEYEIVQNGRTTYEYSMEIGNNSVELETESLGSESEMEFTFFTRNAVNYIKVEFEDESTNEEGEVYFAKSIADDGTVSYIVTNL